QRRPQGRSQAFGPALIHFPRGDPSMDLIGALVSLAIGLVLIVACGGFVAAEFSLITANRNEVEAAAESGDKRAGGVLQGMKSLSTQLSVAPLGITLTNLGTGVLPQPAIAALAGPALLDAGLGAVAARSVSVTIALVLATGMTMTFGELVPKNMAIAEPLRTAELVVGFQRLFTKVFGLPIRLFNGNANAVVRASASSRRRSSAPPAAPTSSRCWSSAPPMRGRSPRRPPRWCSAPSPSATGARTTRWSRAAGWTPSRSATRWPSCSSWPASPGTPASRCWTTRTRSQASPTSVTASPSPSTSAPPPPSRP